MSKQIVIPTLEGLAEQIVRGDHEWRMGLSPGNPHLTVGDTLTKDGLRISVTFGVAYWRDSSYPYEPYMACEVIIAPSTSEYRGELRCTFKPSDEKSWEGIVLPLQKLWDSR